MKTMQVVELVSQYVPELFESKKMKMGTLSARIPWEKRSGTWTSSDSSAVMKLWGKMVRQRAVVLRGGGGGGGQSLAEKTRPRPSITQPATDGKQGTSKLRRLKKIETESEKLFGRARVASLSKKR